MNAEAQTAPQVLLDRVPGSPVTAVYLLVRAGSADEAPDQVGAAHFVEHMLFKGTQARALEDCAPAIEAMGGEVNAYTTYDRTVVHATVMRDDWEQALDVLADMVLRPRFDPADVELEREVVLEEIRGELDVPSTMLAEAVAARVFTEHPYGRPVIGTMRSVAALSRKRLMDFHARWYRPSNIVVSVSGDVCADALQAAVNERFQGPPLPAPTRSRPPEPPQTRRRTVVLEDRFEEPLVELAWPGVDVTHPDSAPLDVLLSMLGGSPSSALGEVLQLKGLATETWAICETERDPGMLLLGCAPLSGHVGACVQGLIQVVAEVRQGHHLRLDGMQRAKTQILSSRTFQRQTVDGRAHDRVWYADAVGDPDGELAYRARVEAVGLADLRRVARAWLEPRRMTAGAVLPHGELDTAAFRALLAPPRVPRAADRPPILRHTLDNGVRVVVESLPESGVVAVRAALTGGQLIEDAGTAGVSELWGRTVGLPGLPARALAELLDARGGALGSVRTWQSMGLRSEFPAARLDDALELISGMLSRPSFPADEVARVRAELREELLLSEQRPLRRAQRRLLERLFGAHPYALPAGGSRQSLARLGVASVKRLHRAVVQPHNLVVSVVGAVDPDAAIAQVERRLGSLSGTGVQLPERPGAAFPGHELHRLPSDREQAHVLIGWPGASSQDADRLALVLAGEVLSGQGGRLFLELRDRRSLAYSVGADVRVGLDAGAVVAQISVDPRRAEEARAGLLQVIQELASNGPTAAEVDGTRRRLTGSLLISRQEASARARELATWELRGKDPRVARARLSERLAAVTADEMRDALAARLALGGVQVVIGGQP